MIFAAFAARRVRASTFLRVGALVSILQSGAAFAGYWVGYVETGCFPTKPAAVNAYCTYINPNEEENITWQRDSCVLTSPDLVHINAHYTIHSTGVTVPFEFDNGVGTCADEIDPPKNNGNDSCDCMDGNPIHGGTG